MPRILIEDLPVQTTLTPEEQEELIGAGRFKPAFDSLEERQLMSTTPLAPAIPKPTFDAGLQKQLAEGIGVDYGTSKVTSATTFAQGALDDLGGAANKLVNQDIVAYDFTSTGKLTVNLMTGDLYADIDVAAGVHIDTEFLKGYLRGETTLPKVDVLEAAVSAVGMKLDRSSNYAQVRDSFYSKYGADNVYFSSERFTDWASPETVARHLAVGIASGGATAKASLKEVKQMLVAEGKDLLSWAKTNKLDAKQVMSLVNQIFISVASQQELDSPYVAVKFTRIAYNYDLQSNIGAVNQALDKAGAEANSGHLGFAIIWKSPGVQFAETLANFDKLKMSSVQDFAAGTLTDTAVGVASDYAKDYITQGADFDFATALQDNLAQEATMKALSHALVTKLNIQQKDLQLAFTNGDPTIDLKGTAVARRLEDFVKFLAQGNEGKARIDRLEFNLTNFQLNAMVSIRHRHVWGSAADLAKMLAAMAGKMGAKAVQTINEYGQKVISGLDKAGNFVRTTVDAAGNVIRQTIDKHGAIAQEAWDKAGNVARQTMDRYGNFAKETWDKTGAATKQALTKAGTKIKDTWTKAGKHTKETFEKTGATLKQVWDKAGKLIEKVSVDKYGKKIQETWDSTGKHLYTVYEKGVKTLQKTYMNGVNTLEERWEAGSKTLKKVWDKAGNLLSKDTWDSAGKHVYTAYKNGYATLQKTYVKGVAILEEQWSKGTQTLKKVWDKAGNLLTKDTWDAGKHIYTEYKNGISTLERTWVKGVQTLERKWANGKQTLNLVWDKAGNLLSKDTWNSAGEHVYTEFKNGYSTLKRVWHNGKQTFEAKWENGKQTLELVWDKAGNLLTKHTWNSAGEHVYMEFKNGYSTLKRVWKNGKQTVEQQWQNGKQTLNRAWDTAGKLLKNDAWDSAGNSISKGAKTVGGWLGF